MPHFLERLRKARKRLWFFRRRAFAPETEILSHIGSRLRRFRSFRVGWLGILFVSLLVHSLVLPFLLQRDLNLQRREMDRERSFTVRFARPARQERRTESSPPAQEPETTPEPLRKSTTEAPVATPEPTVFGPGAGPPTTAAGSGIAEGSGSRSAREVALDHFGGSEDTEAAVRRGLTWLARHQNPDGRWDCDNFDRRCPPSDRCGNGGHSHYDVGVTALALAAFVAQGAEAPDTWRQVADRAVAFLVEAQRPGGAFGREEARFMYNQAIATYALAQTYRQRSNEALGGFDNESSGEKRGQGFTDASVQDAWAAGGARLGKAIQSALLYSEGAQQAGGGWDYTGKATGRNDLSITGWQILGIEAATAAGFSFPAERIDRAHSMIHRMVEQPEAGVVTYADSGMDAGDKRRGLVPVAILGLLLCGEPLNSPPVKHMADAMLRTLPDDRGRRDFQESGQSLYYWYYGTLALFHLGGAWWETWNPAMKDVLVRLQRTDGHRAGSWDPDPNWTGDIGGRVYATAIAVLTLEVYYRVTPRHVERSKGATP